MIKFVEQIRLLSFNERKGRVQIDRDFIPNFSTTLHWRNIMLLTLGFRKSVASIYLQSINII